jgi:GAF domain-containing protein
MKIGKRARAIAPKDSLLNHGWDQGNIALQNYVARVYMKTHKNLIQLIAHNQEEIFGLVTLKILSQKNQLARLQSAKSLISGEHVIFNLLVWANRNLNLSIISPTKPSALQDTVWRCLAGSQHLHVKVYLWNQDQVHATDNIETHSHGRWCYILQQNNLSKFGTPINSGSPVFLMPYHYAVAGLPENW